jgi:alpha-tubulin suppressor-like RCC1 family protein
MNIMELHSRLRPMKTFQIMFVSTVLSLFFQAALAGSFPGIVIDWGANIAGEATGIPAYPNTTNIDILKKLSPTASGVVAVSGRLITNALAIAAGKNHSLALESDGTVVGWGDDYFGESKGLKTDGHVLRNVVAIAAGENHSLALKSDGTVAAFGDNQHGQAAVPVGATNVTAIAAGWIGSMALKKDGAIVGWGQVNVPMGLSNVVAIAATSAFYGHDLALKKDGVVIEWVARGVNGDIDIKSGLSNVVAIAAGANHSLALKEDGTVFGWGDNSKGQATGIPTKEAPYSSSGLVAVRGRTLNDVIAIAAGNEFSLALKKNGTVIAWGRNDFHQTDVPAGLSNVVAISAGDNFCLAITTNHAVAEKFMQK